MGIRSNKILGYGLVDVKHKDHRIADDRFNTDGIGLSDFDEKHENWNLQNYVAWLKEKQPEAFEILEVEVALNLCVTEWEKKERFSKHFIYDGEYGLPNVFCIADVRCRDVIRHADIIDWVEETYFPREQQYVRVQLLPDNISPYSGVWWDTRTGRVLPYSEGQTITRLLLTARQKNNQDAIARLQRLMSEIGFESLEEFEQFAAPKVPDEVINQIEYAKLFNDPKTIYQLKPMLYTYWA